MAFSFNGNTLKVITFNNQDVKKLIYNNTIVWEKQRLPSQYQEVEYIESTGTQYIDTGFIANQDTAVELKFKVTNNTTGFLYSARKNVGGISYSLVWVIGSNNTSKIRFDYSTRQLSFDSNVDNTYIVKQDKNKCYIDGIYKDEHTYSNFTSPSNMLIFATNSSGTVGSYVSSKLYYFKIWDNGTLVRDFIPCYKKETGEAGLYDKVNGLFYKNSGSGVFILGKDILELPSAYQRVEYIESTGTQYIDTGIKPNNNTRVDMTTKAYNTSNVRFFGTVHGTQSKPTTPYYSVGFANAGKWVNQYGNDNNVTTINANVLEHNIIKYNYKLIIDGIEIDNANTQTFYSDYNLYLFCANFSNSAGLITRLYIKSCRIWEYDSVLARNLIPCYRKSDGEIGMYDVVNNVFYTNQGTGTFTKGADI